MSTNPSTHPPSGPLSGPRRRSIAVVVNGRAKSVTNEVIATLDQILKGGDLFVSRSVRDAREIARTLVERGYDTVLTGGGDGTFTVVVTEVVREARAAGAILPRFGLLHLGTGNSLAWVVGASKIIGPAGKGLAADIQRLQEDAGSRSLRLIEVEGNITPFCGLGADATMLEDYAQAKQRLSKTVLKPIAAGPVSYAVAAVTQTLPRFLVTKMPHCRVVNRGADAYRVGSQGRVLGKPIPEGAVLYEGPARIAALSTIPYYGFGFRMFPFADEREDRMQLRISTMRPLPFVKNFREIWKGTYANPEMLADFLVEKVSIEMDPPTAFQIGGDPHGKRSEVIAGLMPETVRIVDYYSPPSAE
ncbi:MAG: diacylglycerol kinase family protein [Polyangiaceae bacterium]|nr:diacylglycerol kinase family protein [Polyangiaceae bacterium]